MTNPFGTKFTYSPVPKTIHWVIRGREQSGKTTLLAKLARPGIALVIDSDGRFGDSVPENSAVEFYPISDDVREMKDTDTIVKVLDKALPQMRNENVTMIAIDTLTNILEPLIQKIQANPNANVYSYREKADAMKNLRTALTKWGCETAWLYHKVEFFDKVGKEYVIKEKNYLSAIEQSRLGRGITIELETVKSDNGRYGLYVAMARRGRSGFTIWDDTGDWSGIREKIEEQVWGGLTKEEQDQLETALPTTFASGDDAIKWAWDYSQNNHQYYKDAKHTENSYNALKKELVEKAKKNDTQLTHSAMFDAWIDYVVSKGETENE